MIAAQGLRSWPSCGVHSWADQAWHGGQPHRMIRTKMFSSRILPVRDVLNDNTVPMNHVGQPPVLHGDALNRANMLRPCGDWRRIGASPHRHDDDGGSVGSGTTRATRRRGPRGAQPTHRILQVRLDLGGGVFTVLGVRTQQVPDEGQC